MLLYNPGIHKCIKYSYSSDIPKLNKHLMSLIARNMKLNIKFNCWHYHINRKNLFLHKDRITEILHVYYGVIPTPHIIIQTYTKSNLAFITNQNYVYDIHDNSYFRSGILKVPFVFTKKFLDTECNDHYYDTHFIITRKCLKIKLGSLGVSLEHDVMKCRKKTISNFKGAK